MELPAANTSSQAEMPSTGGTVSARSSPPEPPRAQPAPTMIPAQRAAMPTRVAARAIGGAA
jgi:hypothetical protein